MEKCEFQVIVDILKTYQKQLSLINKCRNSQMIPPCNNSFSKFKYLEDDENCCSNGLLGSYKLKIVGFRL